MNKNHASRRTTRRPATNRPRRPKFPAGWNEEKVQAVLAYYEKMSDEERAADIEAAAQAADHVLISVPARLVPAVLKLIHRHQRTA